MSPSCSILSSHLHFGAQRIPASMGDMKAPFADISDIPISETAAKIYNFLQSRKYFVKNFKRTKSSITCRSFSSAFQQPCYTRRERPWLSPWHT